MSYNNFLQIAIAEVKREKEMRKKHYPKFIAQKKITYDQAEKAQKDLQIAIDTLEGLLFVQTWFRANHPELLEELGVTGAVMCVLENFRINQGTIKFKEEVVKHEV